MNEAIMKQMSIGKDAVQRVTVRKEKVGGLQFQTKPRIMIKKKTFKTTTKIVFKKINIIIININVNLNINNYDYHYY